MTRFAPIGRALAGTGLALGIVLAGTGVAAAGTVEIQDTADVLSTAPVQSAAATLPVSVYIWTTGQEAAGKLAFDNDVRDKVSTAFPVAIGVNTLLHRSSVQIGSAVGITQSAAGAAANQADAAFDNALKSTRSYTSSVTALLDSLKTSLLAAVPSTTTATTTTAATATGTTHAAATTSSRPAAAAAPPHRGGPGTTVIVVGIVVLVLMLAVLGVVFGGGNRPAAKHVGKAEPGTRRTFEPGAAPLPETGTGNGVAEEPASRGADW